VSASSMPARLRDIRAKIKRAEKYVRDLEKRLQSFRKRDPYGLRVEVDPQSGDQVYRVQIRARIPRAVPLLIGEILYHLRGSLDHLAWQLVLANGATPRTGGNGTSFPIFETAAKYKSDSPRKIQGMSPGAISILDALQPYQGGNDILWKLHELNNIDKHRLLLVAAFGSGTPVVRWIKNHPTKKPAEGVTIMAQPGRARGKRFAILQDGTEIGRVHVHDREDSDVDMDFQPSFEIAFGEPQIVEGEPVVPFLHQLAHLVNGIVDKFCLLP